MIRRSAALAALVLSLPAGALSAQAFEYVPGSAQYRLSSNTKLVQEVMGNRNEMETTADYKVTMNVARKAKDTLAVAMTLDSISLKSSGPMPSLDSLQGLKVNSYVSPTGQFYRADDIADPAKAQVAMEIARLLPRLRAKIAAGDTWTDTTKDSQTLMGSLTVERTVISTSKVLGDTTYAGEKAWRIQRSHSTATAGSGDMQGQALTVEGTATGEGIVYISSKGVFLGATSKDSSKQNVTLVANGMVIPVTSESTTTVERIK